MLRKIRLLGEIGKKQLILLWKNGVLGIAKMPVEIKEFGLKITLLRYLDSLLLFNKRSWYIKNITTYMNSELAEITNKREWGIDEQEFDIGEKIPVWMCWWQGKEGMPEIVQLCIRNVHEHLPDNMQLILLDQYNYKKYVTIPDLILNKNKDGKICMAHMADVMRMKLLAMYGGVWIDATCYLNDGELLEESSRYAFFSPQISSEKITKHESSRGKWCTFYMECKKHSEFAAYVYYALLEYWSKHDSAVDYTLLDYTMYVGYMKNLSFQKDVDEVELCLDNIWLLLVKLNEVYEEKQFQDIMNSSRLFKLSHREEIKKEQNGKRTNFAHLLLENGR